nr:hypothetical protein MFLOJ_25600 [Mycobacterium florentinum]
MLACLVVGCGKTTGGNAVRASTTASSTPTSGTKPRKSDPAEPVPGVEVTPPDHIPPNALACLPAATGNGRMTAASVSDPVAPKLTVPLPDGWNSAPGTGDVALTATGPDGLSVQVTITPTDLEPGGAFLRYGADLRTARPGVQVSVDAAQFCGYSSQLLSGSVGGAGGVAIADRITHIWTNTKAFLVVVHMEGPAGAPGFDAAKSTVMQQFAVVIP